MVVCFSGGVFQWWCVSVVVCFSGGVFQWWCVCSGGVFVVVVCL